MNITFILGNGFDIQLGLKSRYSDFLQEYVEPVLGDSDNIEEFKEYLAQRPNRELWSDAEIAMGMHLGQFSDATIEAYNERVQDFEIHLIDYLRKQQDRCSYSDKKEIAKRFADFLYESFGDAFTRRRDNLDIDKPEHNVFRFISFNYTNLLEQIRKCFDSGIVAARNNQDSVYRDVWGQISHVHGMLNEQIIMGVNDESQLDLTGGTTLTEALRWELIKPTLNHDSGSNFDVPAKNAISKSDIIAIYGVSYGNTDKLWWEEVVDWLRQDTEHKLVLFIRDKPGQFNPAIAWTELNYEKSKRMEMLKKLGVEESAPDFEALAERMYIILNTTRLNLKEILIPSDSDNDAVAASTNPSEPTAI